MPVADPKVYDGFTTQLGGLNNGLDGSLLGVNQYQLLVNGTSRGGFIQQRPGIKRLMQVRPPGDFWQHGGWLRTRSGQIFLVGVSNGRFYRIDPLAKTVVDFTIPGDPNPFTLAQGWSIPGGAEGFWIYQDGQTTPLIWNGSSARRARPDEIKVGKVMAYVQGRIWYSLPDDLTYRATDLVGNQDSGTAAYSYKDSILRETENTFLNEGGEFSVPANSGGITAMIETAVLDTSQGQGPLQVICENLVFSCNTPVDRATWKAVTYPIQTVSLLGAGALGSQSTIHVNGDIFFRSNDGIRSFIVARRYFRDWGNTPQSFEVSNLLKFDQSDLLTFGSAAVYDNRVLMTISPQWSDAGVYHRGLVALDLSPVSSILSPGTPVYDSIWTGLNILSIVDTDQGCYAFVLAFDGSVDLWQLTKEELYDDDTGRVQWSVIPRKFFVERDAAGRPVWNYKRLETADLFYDMLAGSVDFSQFWRPDNYPCWTHWRTWYECAPDCTTVLGCDPPGAFQRNYQPRHRLPTPPEVCVTGVKRPLSTFYELDTRLDITGPARLRGVRYGALRESEPFYSPDCDNPECNPISCCDFDVFGFYTSYGTDGTGGGSGGSGGGSGGSGYPVIPPPFIPPAPPIVGIPIGPDNPPPPDNRPDPPPPPPLPPPFLRGPDWPTQSLGTGAQTWQPTFSDPDGNVRPMGYEPFSQVPGTEIDSNILQSWKDAVGQKWADFKAANGISTTAEQMIWKQVVSSERRYNPTLVFSANVYLTAAWSWELWIEYLT